MKPAPRIFTIRNWTHDPKRRLHRWRCQECMSVIKNGCDVVVERRGRSSHGYHLTCFEAAVASPLPSNAAEVIARASRDAAQ